MKTNSSGSMSKKYFYFIILLIFLLNFNLAARTISCPAITFLDQFKTLLFKSVTQIKSYKQIATQGQLDKYGTIFDIRIMPDGSYTALFKSPVDNNGNYSLILYGLDKNFNQTWDAQIISSPTIISNSFFDFSIEKKLFVYVLPGNSNLETSAVVVNLDNGKRSQNKMQYSQYSGKLQCAKIINYGTNYYLFCMYDGGILNYNLCDWTFTYNPPVFEVLLNYLSDKHARIADCFVINSADGIQNWLLRIVSSEDGDSHQPLTMQTVLYSVYKSAGYLSATFETENYRKYYGTNIQYSQDCNNLILLANLFSYTAYLQTGINQLTCTLYPFNPNNRQITFNVNSQYWSLGHTGEFFLLKDDGLFTASN